MSPTDWDKELAKIDKQLASIPDESLTPVEAAKKPGERQAAAPAREKPPSRLGLATRLLLAVALGIGMAFWPYPARCGTGLFAYLAAIGVLVTAGVWSAVWTWRHRAPRAHVLSLVVLGWGVVLGAAEILPRVGYATPTPSHPAIWMCE